MHRRKPDSECDRKLDGDAEARLIKLACSDPPEGQARWTLHLLADELVTPTRSTSSRSLTKPSDNV